MGVTQAASALPSLGVNGLSSAVTAMAMTGVAPWPLLLLAMALLVLGAGSRRAAQAVAARA